jgi:ABC-type antimicrobial peptide transport system permease subunit
VVGYLVVGILVVSAMNVIATDSFPDDIRGRIVAGTATTIWPVVLVALTLACCGWAVNRLSPRKR